MTRYRWVDSQKADHDIPVAAACDAPGDSRSANYAWAASRRSRPSRRERAGARLLSIVRRIHKPSDDTYGSPRVTRQLRHDGDVVNHKCVERIMATWRQRRGRRAVADRPSPADGHGHGDGGLRAARHAHHGLTALMDDVPDFAHRVPVSMTHRLRAAAELLAVQSGGNALGGRPRAD